MSERKHFIDTYFVYTYEMGRMDDGQLFDTFYIQYRTHIKASHSIPLRAFCP